MAKALEIVGFLEADSVREPFLARITEPKASAGPQEYSCLVHAPALFEKDKKIFGVDADQARELAIQFLKTMLEGKRLTDKAGRPIDVARLR
jgi:hypothetical protein